MNDTIDLLKIKIETAKRELSPETVSAIDAVDWKTSILELRNKYGYTFEQLGDLELETELLLCGLVSAENYPKEIEKRMKISKAQANELVNEMNNLVFKRMREELTKNLDRKKIIADSEKNTADTGQILNSAGIEIVPEKLELSPGETPTESREKMLQKIEKPAATIPAAPKEEPHPILAQKLSGSFQTPIVKTDHSLENITKTAGEPKPPAPQGPKIDPYREIPE